MITTVDEAYNHYKSLINTETVLNNLSLRNIIEEIFRKTLLLFAASLFEDQIKSSIIMASEQSLDDDKLINFIKRKAIERQYHTYFDWKVSNINYFASHFGVEFRNSLRIDIDNNEGMSIGEAAFMYIGSERNKMLHSNLITYSLDDSVDDVYSKYINASRFVEYVGAKIASKQPGQ